MKQANSTTKQSALIWDLPVRVFHWLLVLSFAMAWLSYDSDRYLDIHVFAGYTFLGLLIFRLIWGVFGTHYARFKQFSYSFSEVLAYVKGLFGEDMRRYAGHNPAGSWAIFALIGLGLLLTISGLFLLGGEEQLGPLAGVITFQQSVIFHELHEVVAFLLLALVFVHLCGVITESLLHRENLVGSMFRGTKWVEGQSAKVPAHKLLAATLLTVVIGWGGVNFSGYLLADSEHPYIPFKGPQLAMNEAWDEECGSCHMPYHPSLLPERSWKQLFADQEQHFGDDLMLEPEMIQQLQQYASKNAANLEQTEAAWRINQSIKPDETPQRITETRYWRKTHDDITEQVWQQELVGSKANCDACHLDALQGTFMDAAMRIPGEKPWYQF